MGSGIGGQAFLMAKVRVEMLGNWGPGLPYGKGEGRDMGSGIGGQAFLMAKVRVETWARVLGAVASLWQR